MRQKEGPSAMRYADATTLTSEKQSWAVMMLRGAVHAKFKLSVDSAEYHKS
jgi:hypothetical protein